MSLLDRLRTPKNNAGEMPFFDHLEELRWRILWSVLALFVCTGAAFYVVLRFDLLALLKRPLDPYIEGKKLIELSLTGPFFMTFKLALTLGFIAALPIIAYQVWAFLAPALTKRERRAIVPALYMGFVLFAFGVALGYVYVLPPTAKFMASFETSSMELNVTASYYYGFVIKLLVAFGAIFELPVVILILAQLGLVSSHFLSSKRRYAIAIMAVASALLTPGDALTATIFMMGPLIVLYEVSILLTKMVERSKLKAAAADAALESH
jgi:sec-independent protein translocase protein TatC